VSIELARRLLSNGAPTATVEAALMAEVKEGVPFVAAFIALSPELGPLLERELERAEVPAVLTVRPHFESILLAPPGICERLLAIPIRRDAETGRVDVAAVDALGPHVAAEFAFHFGAPVRLFRAEPSELRSALNAVRARVPPGGLGLRAAARMPSDAPIPLVRRPAALNSRAPEAAAVEPVLSLSRAKFVPPAFVFEISLEESLSQIAQSASAEQVGRALCNALEPADAILVAVRSKGLDARVVSRSLSGGDARNLSLPLGKNSVFDAALRAGFYLGPLTPGLQHSELRALLSSDARDEVYSAPVVVAGRPVLVVLMARFGPSLEATQRADKLLSAAGSAIERVLLTRKRAR
jgi:hypothetical protein